MNVSQNSKAILWGYSVDDRAWTHRHQNHQNRSLNVIIASHQVLPREEHLEACYSIFAYLRKCSNMSMVFHPSGMHVIERTVGSIERNGRISTVTWKNRSRKTCVCQSHLCDHHIYITKETKQTHYHPTIQPPWQPTTLCFHCANELHCTSSLVS